MFSTMRRKIVSLLTASFYFIVIGILSAPGGAYGATAQPCKSGNGFCNPLSSGLDTVAGFTEAVLKASVYILFPIAVLFMVYSGFKFVFAQGNSEELAKAKKNFMWTVVGLSLLLGSWALAEVLKGTINPILGN